MNTTIPLEKPCDRAALPIVDLTSFFHDDTQVAKQSAAEMLVAACKDVGFVYVKGHGVPKETLDQAFRVTQRFYDLPMEEKMKAPHPPGWAVHRGYSWPGLEKVSNVTSTDNVDDMAKKLREVQDFKVGRLTHTRHSLTQDDRKATRLARKRIQICPMYGYLTKYFLIGVLS